ncbi:MAG: substrate-binding domain-containing protein, partial [Oscillibacter sp.]|nr:substrate-binding domain-containing protein [Oscillibacter sp.]
MKKTLALLLAAVMMLALLTACGGGDKPADTNGGGQQQTQEPAGTPEPAPEAPAEAGTIGVCIYQFTDAFMTTYRNALQEILEGKGYKVSTADGANDQAKQNEQINTFITQGVDALIIN